MVAGQRQIAGDSLIVRAIRVVVPWVVLAVIAILVFSYLGRYLASTDDNGGEAPTAETTATPEPDTTPDTGTVDDPTSDATSDDVADTPGSIGTVVVLAEGLNLRAEPMTSATVIKQLKEGARLILLEEGTGWYRVRDDVGAEGWVAAGGQYTRLEQ